MPAHSGRAWLVEHFWWSCVLFTGAQLFFEKLVESIEERLRMRERKFYFYAILHVMRVRIEALKGMNERAKEYCFSPPPRTCPWRRAWHVKGFWCLKVNGRVKRWRA